MTALTIAARELRERSRLFLICAALAVLPFVAGLLPGARVDRPGVIATTSSYLALAVALGSAMVLGASTIMRDMVERRLSFYFSKPIPAQAIWWGKAAGCITASFICFAIIALPTALFVADWPGPGLWMVGASELLGLAALGVVMLFFVSHLVASVIRSRSVLIGADFVLLAVLGFVLAAIGRTLLAGGAIELTAMLAAGLAVTFLLLIAIAPVFQLEHGRTDPRRSHAALSRFLWPSLFGVTAIVAAYVWWAASGDPSDLVAVQHLEQAPRGERVSMAGTMRGRGDFRGAFVIERDGSWRRMSTAAWTPVIFSRDGSTMAWMEAAGFVPGARMELHTSRGAATIGMNGYADLALSDDGTRVAIGSAGLVAVHDTSTGRLLMSAGGFNRGMRHRMFFVSNDVVRVIEFAATWSPMRVFELDVARKKLTRTGELIVEDAGPFTASHDGSRLLLRGARRVIDGRTLAAIHDLPQVDAVSSALLHDGRVADIVRKGRQVRLRIQNGPDTPLPVAHAAIVGQLADGKLVVRGTRRAGWSHTGADRTMFVVDPQSGAIVTTVAQVKGPELDWMDVRLPRYDTQRLAGVDREGKLVWWDPRTGRVQHPPRK